MLYTVMASVWSILNSWYNIAILDRNYLIPNRSGEPASTRGCMEGFCIGEYLTDYDLQVLQGDQDAARILGAARCTLSSALCNVS
uniref:Uncharacterized protein n=1 Tax=Hordeum vulgare subsp. vulgare TaxID=112509 RepID=A0A8I6WS54_HORVV